MKGELYYRHTLPVRIMHWINALAATVLLMSGLQIFNAHPSLYWGKSSYTERGPLVEMSEFPGWATIPSSPWLAMGRRWHLTFTWIFVINGIAYVAYSVRSRHLSRDLLPTSADRRSIGRSIVDHLKFRHPRGAAARDYNVLQKLTYLFVIFVLLPMLIITGWAMSPWLNSIGAGWVNALGGRQSARTLHFIAASLLVLFVAVHIFQTIVTGLWNNLRSMITGRYRMPPPVLEDDSRGQP